MELFYLSNGQQCYLKEKIGNKFIVNKVYESEQYYGEDSHMVEHIDENDIIVDAIFENKPIEKIDSEIKALQEKKNKEYNLITDLIKQKRILQNEIDQITKTQITNEKFIINRSELINAERLVLFVKDKIMPITLCNKDKSFRGLKLSTTIEICNGEESSWGYRLYFDEVYPSGDFLCKKYGVLINPTNEEVEETIKKRVLEFQFSDYWIKNADDKYLTEELINKKNSIIQLENERQRNDLERQLKETQEKLSKLQ